MQRSDALSDEQRALLRQRAKELCEPVARSENEVGASDVLVVAADGTRYALPITAVAGLALLDQVTPLVGAPSHVCGVAPIGGTITTIVSLAAVLGSPAGDVTAGVLVETGGGETFALGIESYEGIEPEPSPLSTVDGLSPTAAKFVKGLGPGGLAVLDVPSVVNHLMAGQSESRAAEEEAT